MSNASPIDALSREQLIDRLETEVWASAVPQITRHLAEQVMALLGLNPGGVNLVMWFADARYPSNAGALADWVGRQMADPHFMKTSNRTPAPVVLARLVSELLEKTEAANS